MTAWKGLHPDIPFANIPKFKTPPLSLTIKRNWRKALRQIGYFVDKAFIKTSKKAMKEGYKLIKENAKPIFTAAAPAIGIAGVLGAIYLAQRYISHRSSNTSKVCTRGDCPISLSQWYSCTYAIDGKIDTKEKMQNKLGFHYRARGIARSEEERFPWLQVFRIEAVKNIMRIRKLFNMSEWL